MGAQPKPQAMTMVRVTFLLLLACALSFAVPETEYEYSPEEAHNDAQASIDALVQTGKGDSACRKLASQTKKEIEDGKKKHSETAQPHGRGPELSQIRARSVHIRPGTREKSEKSIQQSRN